MAKTNKRRVKRGRGNTKRFFKNLLRLHNKDAPVGFESKDILDMPANMPVTKKPSDEKRNRRFTRSDVIASAFDFDTYKGAKYGPNNSNSSLSTESESKSYDSQKNLDLNDIGLSFGGKRRKTNKRRYKNKKI
jgi:hypothetical protein